MYKSITKGSQGQWTEAETGSKTEAAGAVVAQERTGRLLGVVEETVYYRCVGEYSQRQGGLDE